MHLDDPQRSVASVPCQAGLYHADIVSIMQHVFVLLDEKRRIDLLRLIAEDLKIRGRYEDRAEWSEQCMAI